jgi:hypothetical protein
LPSLRVQAADLAILFFLTHLLSARHFFSLL